MTTARRSGGCLCGAVRYSVEGEPLRSGLCHCLECRKTSGSYFTPFAVWPSHAFSCSGEMEVYAKRSFCPKCGSRIAWLRSGEAEVNLGTLDDAPSGLVPDYELWVGRRETWLAGLHPVEQFAGDRDMQEGISVFPARPPEGAAGT